MRQTLIHKPFRNIMKTIASLLLAVSALTLATSASAQFAKPEDAIKYRKASLTVMAAHFSRVAGMAAGRIPFDAKAAADNAAIAEVASKLPWAAFGEGTDKGDTKAKAEIWTDQAKFKEASDKMVTEMAKVSAAAKSGNLDAIKTAVGGAAPTCKACHDVFRNN
jgi:cytochrome c556